MKAKVVQVGDRLAIVAPDELVRRRKLIAGAEIDVAPLLPPGDAFEAALDDVVSEHEDALRELAK